MLPFNFTLSKTIATAELTASFPPYYSMYPNTDHMLDIIITLKQPNCTTGDARIRSAQPFRSATQIDIETLFHTVKLKKCTKCSNLRFDAKTVETNRKGLCETCFTQKLKAWFEKAKAKEDEHEAREDQKMKDKGYTHKLIAWIHPKAGGDDYQIITYYTKEPTPKEIETLIAYKHSHITDDYKLTTL